MYNHPPPISPRLPIMAARVPPLPVTRSTPPVSPASTRWLYDLQGNAFEFGLVVWNAPPDVHWATYAFMNIAGAVGYIGKAEGLRDRQSGHERKAEAQRKGYNLLYVHVSGIFARFRYDQVEDVLIKSLQPPMNDKLKSLASFYS